MGIEWVPGPAACDWVCTCVCVCVCVHVDGAVLTLSSPEGSPFSSCHPVAFWPAYALFHGCLLFVFLWRFCALKMDPPLCHSAYGYRCCQMTCFTVRPPKGILSLGPCEFEWGYAPLKSGFCPCRKRGIEKENGG